MSYKLRKRTKVDYSDCSSTDSKRLKLSDYSSLGSSIDNNSSIFDADLIEYVSECDSLREKSHFKNEKNNSMASIHCKDYMNNGNCDSTEKSRMDGVGETQHGSRSNLDDVLHMRPNLSRENPLPTKSSCKLNVSFIKPEMPTEILSDLIECNKCGKSVKRKFYDSHLYHLCGYTCQICGKKCASKWKYKKHMPIHRSPHQCSMCTEKFKYKIYLAKHCSIDHFQVQPPLYKCFECGKVVKALPAHIRIHDENPMCCTVPECGYQLKNFSALKEHIRQHSRSKVPVPIIPRDHELRKEPKQCSECDFVGTKKLEMLRHYKEHVLTPQFPCPLCDKKTEFKNLFELNIHVSRVHWKIPNDGVRCCICSQTFQASDFNNHFNSHMPDPYECEVCQITFSSLAMVNRHITRRHKRKNKHLTVVERLRLKYHSRLRTSVNVKCLFCGLRMSTGQMKEHVSKCHRGCICRLCHKKLPNRDLLQEHQAAHDSVFRDCLHCERSFLSTIRLAAHLLRQHNLLLPPSVLS